MKNKIVMLGTSGVGKTALVTRWVESTFEPYSEPTIGASYVQTSLEVYGKNLKVQLWDTAGQEKYRSIAPVYARGSFGAVIVFDLTSEQSFNEIPEWIKCADTGEKIPMILVGNKADLADKRKISYEQAFAYANKLGLEYHETSAVNGFGVSEAFVSLVHHAVDAREARSAGGPNDFQIIPDEGKSNGCC